MKFLRLVYRNLIDVFFLFVLVLFSCFGNCVGGFCGWIFENFVRVVNLGVVVGFLEVVGFGCFVSGFGLVWIVG